MNEPTPSQELNQRLRENWARRRREKYSTETDPGLCIRSVCQAEIERLERRVCVLQVELEATERTAENFRRDVSERTDKMLALIRGPR